MAIRAVLFALLIAAGGVGCGGDCKKSGCAADQYCGYVETELGCYDKCKSTDRNDCTCASSQCNGNVCTRDCLLVEK